MVKGMQVTSVSIHVGNGNGVVQVVSSECAVYIHGSPEEIVAFADEIRRMAQEKWDNKTNAGYDEFSPVLGGEG